jgi:ArsR family transcriptional regulator, zinc-responsive transcriptional repressor
VHETASVARRIRPGGLVAPGRAGPARARRRGLHKHIGMCLYKEVSAQTKAFEAAGELLRVLAAPARLAIVAELAEQPRFVHELVDRLGMSQPLVSQHLRVLRGARLVGVERRGREAVYSLADLHVAHIVADAVHHSREEP